ncbi:conserved uncharacterized protein [Stigmatella aurantiaca DW4/3-1]|uniref:Conserved uncharacterized protein n=2 Tax=Stigmatella aurantiaca TaxID=41 RepID=Q08ZG7_STIAD|nr:conserved uncharacterized protein [Stigmatella aurantiaca DW4/3-1]EAU65884.1 hypothetical protein STIAU_5172 [Stigmatella aurantiaca DW4/3-1]
MSDGRKVPERGGPPRETPASPPSGPSRPGANPGGARVMSAARPAQAEKKGAELQVGKRVASEASNAVLNAISILKEMVQDFREQDRFFKYKAGIVGGWVAISLMSLVIACPGRSIETTSLGARVTVLPNPERPTASPSLTVTNTDDEPWENVIFVVNGKYRAIVEKIDAGGIFTLTPKSMLSPDGAMPSNERFINAEMRTNAGRSELVREGQPLTQ